MEENPYSILNELQKRQHYKPEGRSPFSADLIRYPLRQAYKLLLEKLSLPFFSLLEKIHIYSSKIYSSKITLGKKVIFFRTVLLVDEMYLQKGTQFHGGEYIGANEKDKGIMVFMITGLKKTKKKNSTVCC